MRTGKNYKWELRRGSQKEICPQCGKRRFVPFVLAADGKTMAGAEYGRCDREQNCGYFRYPGSDIATPTVVAVKQKPTPAPYVFRKEVVKTKWSVLFDYALRLCGQAAYSIWDMYKIGATTDGATIFWYIDCNGIVRSGKEIKYQSNGHRDKTHFPPVTWAHKDLCFSHDFTGETLLQPLYGEHLLKARPNAKVAIVESEKTAALMSAFYPNNIWLACGGSQGIKNDDKMKPLRGRRVILIPDHGQYFNWLRIAEKNKWECFSYIESKPLFEGCDILDYFDLALK